ncbi:histidine kinase dimerization/phosphoacceptor domain -containing protein [Geminocystis sp. CENA526]|uniref:histidine kinase dimerization/phosphoacceptor domain -containing protein n=1 Tax=Geminocystis sp. CENA526 TaxID=1355871 RepID=UPI003D6DC0F1
MSKYLLSKHIITIKNEQQNFSQDFILDNETYSIGRNSENNIVISHSLISRYHCVIMPMFYNSIDQKISYWIIDGNLKGKRSANGIFVDRKRCLSHELKSQDVVDLGGVNSGIQIIYRVIKFEQENNLEEKSSTKVNLQNKNDITLINSDQFNTTFNQSIQEQEEKYRSVVRQIAQDIILADLDTKQIIEANIAFCNLIGYTESELTKLKIYELQTINTEVFDTQIQQIEQEKLNIIYDSTLLHKDGSLIDVELNISIIYLSQTSLICYTVRDIRQIKQFQRQLSQSLDEKQLLLKEIHHRVKNNLLVVSSILDWQCEFTDDDKILQLMTETQKRIRTIALIHEKLYKSPDFSNIDIAQYIQNLVDQLYLSFVHNQQKIEINFELESIIFNIETVTPCGLIVNELISNALKHAFIGRNQGSITISLKTDNNKYLLTVKDDGIGFPEQWELEKSESLGLQLVSLLTSQLDGELSIGKEEGTVVKILFQKQKYQRRY